MIVMRSVKTIYHSLDKLKADIVQKFVEKVSKSMEKINKLEWTISLQQTTIDDLKIKCGGKKQYSRRRYLRSNGIEMKKEESVKDLKSKLPEFYKLVKVPFNPENIDRFHCIGPLLIRQVKYVNH